MAMKKLLLALQYWPGDQTAAYGLAQLVAEMARKHYKGRCQSADFLFSARWDATIDLEIVRQVALAFQAVHTLRGATKGEGWPLGCNGLAYDTYRHFHQQHKRGLWKYDAIFMIESDSVPLAMDWIDQVAAEWREAGQKVLGFYVASPDEGGHHINGNCLLAPDFLDLFPGFGRGNVLDQGWDVIFRQEMLSVGRPSRLIYSDYQLGWDNNPWQGPASLFAPKGLPTHHPLAQQSPLRPAWLHGVKCTDIAYQCVRDRFLGDKPVQDYSEHVGFDPMYPVGVPLMHNG